MNISIPENAVTNAIHNAVASAIERNPIVAGVVIGASAAAVTVLAAPHVYRLARQGATVVAETAEDLAARIWVALRRNPEPDMNKPGPTLQGDDFIEKMTA